MITRMPPVPVCCNWVEVEWGASWDLKILHTHDWHDGCSGLTYQLRGHNCLQQWMFIPAPGSSSQLLHQLQSPCWGNHKRWGQRDSWWVPAAGLSYEMSMGKFPDSGMEMAMSFWCFLGNSSLASITSFLKFSIC